LAQARAALRALPEDSTEQISEKRRRFEAVQRDRVANAWGAAADLFVAAFLLPKTGGPPSVGQAPTVPTTSDFWQALAGEDGNQPLTSRAKQVVRDAHVFHWAIEFPDVMARGGFDVVLGNPPWDTMSPNAKEFFSPYDGQVRFMSPDDQKARIAELLTLPSLPRPGMFIAIDCMRLRTFSRKAAATRSSLKATLGREISTFIGYSPNWH
jgi:hypothetical protein